MTEDGRLRLTILGGYLGAGKTTWLRHQLHTGAFGHVHVIVNEAAATPVDDALLHGAVGMTLLAGACACCDGRLELRAALLRLCDARTARRTTGHRLDNVILETSGLADPGAILALVHDDPVLVRQILVTEVVVVVDALHALDQLRAEGLSRAQIEAADRLIVTKLDAGGPGLASLIATLRGLAPGAALSATTFGNASDLPDVSRGTAPVPLLHLADAAPAVAVTLSLGPAPDWTAFTVWLSALLHVHGDRIVRVKGVVRTPAGRLLIQAVRHAVQRPEVLPDIPSATDNTIAVIGRGIDAATLGASLRRFAS